MSCDNAIPINNLTDIWNATGNYKVAIQMDVTDTSSATNSRLLDLLLDSVSKFAVGKDGCIITACPGIWIQNSSQDGFGITGNNPSIFMDGNSIFSFSSVGLFPATNQDMDLGSTSTLFNNIYQLTESSSAPTTGDYGGHGAWGVHSDIVADTRYIAVNNSGNIETIQFGAKPVAGYDEGSLLISSADGFNFTGAGVTATLVGSTVYVNIPGSSGGGGSGNPLAIYNDSSLLHSDVVQIHFTGSGVTATNLGNIVTIDIPGTNSFTGILHNASLSGDGAATQLGINFSTDSNNAAITGTDGALYVATVNPFTGVIHDISLTGDGLNTTLGLAALATGDFITEVSTILPITGNGVGSNIGILISTDTNNQITLGVDSGIFVATGNYFTGVIHDDSLTGNGYGSNLSVKLSSDSYNTIYFGSDGGIISTGVTVFDEGMLKSTNISSINFVGDGVTASNIGSNITVNIPGGSGGSGTFAGVLTDSTLQGDGDATNLGIAFSIDPNNIATTGSDGRLYVEDVSFTGVLTTPSITGDGLNISLGIPVSADANNQLIIGTDNRLYVPTGNYFTGVLHDASLTGNGFTTNLGLAPLATGNFITEVSTTLPITGNGVSNSIGLLISSDSGNLTTSGTDGGIFTSFANMSITGNYYFGKTQSGFTPTTTDLFFNDVNYIEEDPFNMSDGTGTITIQKNGRYLIDVEGSMSNTTISGYVELKHNGTAFVRNHIRDIGGSVLGLPFGLTAYRTMSSGDTLQLTHSNSGTYNDVMFRVSEYLDITTFYGNFTGSPISVLDESILLTNNVTSLNFTGVGVNATNSGGAVTIAITGTSNPDTNIFNSDITQTTNRSHDMAGNDIAIINANSFSVSAQTSTDGLVINTGFVRIGDGNGNTPSVSVDSITGDINLVANVSHIANSTTSPSHLRFHESGVSSNYIGFRSPNSLVTDTTYILPTGYGSNTAVLMTDSTGSLSWADGAFSNFANTNLTQTSNRTHNSSGFNYSHINNLTYSVILSGLVNGIYLATGTQIFGALAGGDPSITLDRSDNTLTLEANSGIDVVSTSAASIRIHAGGQDDPYIGFTVISGLPSSVMYTLPTGDGSPNYFLKTNGFGQLSWTSGTDGGGAREFTDAELDLGLIPLNVSATSGTAANNRTALNNFFANTDVDIRKRQLVLPGLGYGVDTTIVIPKKSGFTIRCNGNTDFLGEDEYVGGSTNLGGPASRLVRIGNLTTPMITDNGYGTQIIGTLVLEGYYHADTIDKFTYLNISSNIRPSVGYLINGDSSGVAISAGGQILDGLCVIGCDVGLKIIDTYSGGGGVVQAGDRIWISHLESHKCKIGLKINGYGSSHNSFGNYVCSNSNIAVEFGDGNAQDLGASLQSRFNSIVVDGNYDTTGVTTVFNINSAQENTASLSVGTLNITDCSNNFSIINMPDNDKHRPIHVNVDAGHWSCTNTKEYNRSSLRGNAALKISNFYGLENDMFEMHSTTSGIPNLILDSCRFISGHGPGDVVNAAASTGNRNIKWYGCYDQFGTAAADGQIII